MKSPCPYWLASVILGAAVLFPEPLCADWAEIVSSDPPAPAVLEVGQDVVFKVRFGVSTVKPPETYIPYPVIAAEPVDALGLYQTCTYASLSSNESYVVVTLYKPAQVHEFLIAMWGGPGRSPINTRQKFDIEWIPRKIDPKRINTDPLFKDIAVTIDQDFPNKAKFCEALAAKGIRDTTSQKVLIRRFPGGAKYPKIIYVDAREQSSLPQYYSRSGTKTGQNTNEDNFVVFVDPGVDLRTVPALLDVAQQFTDRIDDIWLCFPAVADRLQRHISIWRKSSYLSAQGSIIYMVGSLAKQDEVYQQQHRHEEGYTMDYSAIKRHLAKDELNRFASHCKEIGERESKGPSDELATAYLKFFEDFPKDRSSHLKRFAEVCEACGESAKAVEVLHRFCSQMKPSESDAYEMLSAAGQYFMKKNQKEKAIDVYLKLIYTGPYRAAPAARAKLAEKIAGLYEQTGQKVAGLGFLITIDQSLKAESYWDEKSHLRLDALIRRFRQDLSK